MSWTARVEGWLLRLGALQYRRPWAFFTVCAVLTVAASLLAMRLELRTRFDQLLPQDKPSVVELNRIAGKTNSSSKIFVLLEGDDRVRLRAMGDALVPRLRAIGAPWVTGADDGVQEARKFLLARSGLFATVQQLEELKADIDERWDKEVGKAFGADLDDEPEQKAFTRDDLEKRFFSGSGASARELDKQYPDGYFESKDGKALLVLVRSTAQSGDLPLSRASLDKVQAVVSEFEKDARFAGVRVGYAGDLVTSLYEYGVVRDDLASVGALGVFLVLGIVYLFYMRVRALVAMGLTVAAGLAWTFGVTYLVIGHLNVATGFLFSIVAGNGINAGIILMARYFEARRDGEAVEQAVLTAHKETWLATLTAAVAAGSAYASLAVTEFRGFKHFAVIGAAGMVLCWLATYFLTPAVLVLTERRTPFVADDKSSGFFARLRASGSRFDAPFVWLVPRAPKTIMAFGLLTALVSIALTVVWVKRDPMEYDSRRTQTARSSASSEIYRVSDKGKEILGARTDGGMVLLVDRLDQVEPLVAELEKRRDAAPANDKPFSAVHTLLELVPKDQGPKLPVLEAIRDKLTRARDKRFIKDEDWKQIESFLPPKGLVAFGVAELPEDIARPFTENDGTRGRLVYVAPTPGRDEDDLHYLLAWADSFRETKLPNGEVLRGSGRAVIFADMLRAVIADVPIAIASSLGLTILAVVLTFRGQGHGPSRAPGGAGWVLAALFVGIAWTGGYLALTHVKINFLNFIALPITFGIGADYAVNVMQRYRSTGSVLEAIRSAGGAVVLCSLTTMLGYLALIRSINQAVRGLGLVAVMGEVACLLAAVAVLPAALRWWETRKRASSPELTSPSPGLGRSP